VELTHVQEAEYTYHHCFQQWSFLRKFWIQYMLQQMIGNIQITFRTVQIHNVLIWNNIHNRALRHLYNRLILSYYGHIPLDFYNLSDHMHRPFSRCDQLESSSQNWPTSCRKSMDPRLDLKLPFLYRLELIHPYH